MRREDQYMNGVTFRRLVAIILCGIPLVVTGFIEVTPVSTEQLWDHYGIFIVINVVIICVVVLPLLYVYLKGRREGEEVESGKTPPVEPGLKNPDDGVTCPHCGGINKSNNKMCYRCGWRINI